MHSRAYLHPVWRIYSIRLTDFLAEWPEDGKSSADSEGVSALPAAKQPPLLWTPTEKSPQGDAIALAELSAERFFKSVCSRNPVDPQRNPEAGSAAVKSLAEIIGSDRFRHGRCAGRRQRRLRRARRRAAGVPPVEATAAAGVEKGLARLQLHHGRSLLRKRPPAMEGRNGKPGMRIRKGPLIGPGPRRSHDCPNASPRSPAEAGRPGCRTGLLPKPSYGKE